MEFLGGADYTAILKKMIVPTLLLLLQVAVDFSFGQEASSAASSLYPFDVLEPIVRLSPAIRAEGDPMGDRFGYSAVAHQLKKPTSDDDYLEALQNTVWATS